MKKVALGRNERISNDVDAKNKSQDGACCLYPSGMRIEERPRYDALRPGGQATLAFLAQNPTVLQIGSTVFAHGGVTPNHVCYGIDRINEEGRQWMLGELPHIPEFYRGREAVVWTRDYSNVERSRCNCARLQTALDGIPGATRMVVGHTIQPEGINSACNDKVFRVDVGLSRGCGDGEPEVLEITDDSVVKVLRPYADPIVLCDGQKTKGQI